MSEALEDTVAAGELSAAFIGSRVRLTRQSGHITTIIEDTLSAVRHEVEQTTLFFVGTQWRTQGLLTTSDDVGATVGSDHRVEVLLTGGSR